jgi:hypothetical protein
MEKAPLSCCGCVLAYFYRKCEARSDGRSLGRISVARRQLVAMASAQAAIPALTATPVALSRGYASDLDRRIGKCSWMGQLEGVTVDRLAGSAFELVSAGTPQEKPPK